MREQKTKRCHWVPQSYMKYFAADPAGQKIWRLSMHAGAPELKPIKKMAVKFHLYAPFGPNGQRDDSLERKLARLEAWLGHDVWKTLCVGEMDLTWQPLRKLISLFAATTYVRNPLQFERWKEIHNQIRDDFLQFDTLPEEVVIGGVRRQIDVSGWEDFRIADEEKMKFDWNRYVGSAGDIAPKFLEMRMVVLKSKRPVFITSDNPIVVVHPSLSFRGLGDPDTMVIFPISPTRTLIFDNKRQEPDGVYYELADDDDGAAQNLLIMRNADEWVFSSRHPDLVCVELLGDTNLHQFPL